MKQEASKWSGVAAAIRERMAALNIDQAELVRQSGLSDPFVRGMMRGTPRGEPREKNVRQLATSLGWSPDSVDRLLAGDEPEVLYDPEPAGVIDLATEIRDALSKTSSRDEKLEEIITAVKEVARLVVKVSRQVDANRQQIELFCERYDVPIVQTPSELPR